MPTGLLLLFFLASLQAVKASYIYIYIPQHTYPANFNPFFSRYDPTYSFFFLIFQHVPDEKEYSLAHVELSLQKGWLVFNIYIFSSLFSKSFWHISTNSFMGLKDLGIVYIGLSYFLC